MAKAPANGEEKAKKTDPDNVFVTPTKDGQKVMVWIGSAYSEAREALKAAKVQFFQPEGSKGGSWLMPNEKWAAIEDTVRAAARLDMARISEGRVEREAAKAEAKANKPEPTAEELAAKEKAIEERTANRDKTRFPILASDDVTLNDPLILTDGTETVVGKLGDPFTPSEASLDRINQVFGTEFKVGDEIRYAIAPQPELDKTADNDGLGM